MKHKILSTIVALLLVVALLPMSILAASYTDTDGHWAEKSIDRWSAAGIVQGTGDAFAPDSDLTCAQLATILAKLLRLPAADDAGFSDNLADAWYYDAINRCAAAGILNGYADGTVRPNETIRRARAMVMLARALGIEPASTSVLNGYADAANVPDWARGYVAALLRADIVSGVSGSRLAALANITRAQFVTILDRAIAIYADEDGATVKADDVDGIIVVVAEDVQIKNAPAGTKVVAAASAKSLKVNGKSVDANDIHTVPETAERPKSVGHAHSHEYKYTDNGDGTHTGVCTANDSTLDPAEHVFDENRKCTICGAVQPETAVASVKAADGTVTYFETLAQAVANAPAGSTVALLNGQELSAHLEVSKQVTLDLNGKTLETKGYAIRVQGSGDLTVTGNGTVNNDQEPVMVGKNKNYRTLFFVEGGDARLTIENGTFTTKSSQAIFAEGTVTIHDGTFENTAESVNGVLDSSAMITAVGSAAKMIIHKASVFATAETGDNGIYGIYGANGAHITLEDGVEVATSFAAIGMNNTTSDPEVVITVNGGTYRSECAQLNAEKYSKFNTVCYLPGKCQMTVNGGTFIAGNEKMHIFSVPYAQAGMNLTITDGTFTAGSNVFYSRNDSHSNQTTNNSIAVSGGSFTGTVADFHENNTFSAFITGGTFRTDPSGYVAKGYLAIAQEDGLYRVVEGAGKVEVTLSELGSISLPGGPKKNGEASTTFTVDLDGETVEAGDIAYSENNSGYTGKGVLIGSRSMNHYAATPAGAGDYKYVIQGGTITSAATGYESIDGLSNTSVYMLVPGNSDVTFEDVTFEGVFSFDVQMYTSPWSYLNSITFKNCTFNGIIVGSCPANQATFDGCTFNSYENTVKANNSNPIWWRAATGYWGEGADESVHSLEKFTFVNNKVTGTRPVKIERIGWNCTAKITIAGNTFDISAQKDDTETKNMAINIGQKDANSKFILTDEGNAISANTAALYTAALSSGSNQYIEVSGSKVLDGSGNEKVITAMVWKTTTGETFEIKSIG